MSTHTVCAWSCFQYQIKTFYAKKLSLLVVIYTLLPSKEADSEKLNCTLTCLGLSEWCLSAPAVELEYKPEARFIPGPEYVQAFLEVHTATEQIQQLRSVSCPDSGCCWLSAGFVVLALRTWQGCAGTSQAV